MADIKLGDLVIPEPRWESVTIPIIGTSPLVMHKWRWRRDWPPGIGNCHAYARWRREMAAKKPANAAEAIDLSGIEILEPNMDEVTIPIVGVSRLVTHKFSEKARKQMRDKQRGKARIKLPPKNPEQEYNDAMYKFEEILDPGIPSTMFKKAAVNACRFTKGITMVVARGVLFVKHEGYDHEDGTELIPIYGDGPHMREDLVKIARQTADLRYRPEWRTWWCEPTFMFNANVITLEQVVNLVKLAGLHSGIGEGRPSSPSNTMDWGLFRGAKADEYEALTAKPKKSKPVKTRGDKLREAA